MSFPGRAASGLLLLAAVAVAAACTPGGGARTTAPQRTAVAPVSVSGDVVAETIRLVNLERARHGLAPLRANRRLTEAARFHAEYMARHDCFDHNCLGGPTFVQRIGTAGYPYRRAAENIAAGMDSPRQVVAAWMGSKGHRANILNPDVDEAGVGYFVLSEDGGSQKWRHYWSMTYGKKF